MNLEPIITHWTYCYHVTAVVNLHRPSTHASSVSGRNPVSEVGSKRSIELPANARHPTSTPESGDPVPEPGSTRSKSHRRRLHGNPRGLRRLSQHPRVLLARHGFGSDARRHEDVPTDGRGEVCDNPRTDPLAARGERALANSLINLQYRSILGRRREEESTWNRRIPAGRVLRGPA